jgi:hypothetical protein
METTTETNAATLVETAEMIQAKVVFIPITFIERLLVD